MIKKLLLLLLLLIFVILNSSCSSLLYYPDKEKLIDPAKLGFRPIDIWMTSSAGLNVHAWYFEAEPATSKGTVIFFHGNSENLSTHFTILAWISKKNYNVLIFDYAGYGNSEGSPNPLNTIQSGETAIRWAAEKDSRPLIIYGQSLGGIVATRTVEELKSEFKFKTIILDSSFDSYKVVAQRTLAKSWFTWIFQPLGNIVMSDEYAPRPIANISPIPILFIHGEKDRIVDSIFSKEMYLKANEPKQLWLIPEGQHGSTFLINNNEYRDKLLKYLSEL